MASEKEYLKLWLRFDDVSDPWKDSSPEQVPNTNWYVQNELSLVDNSLLGGKALYCSDSNYNRLCALNTCKMGGQSFTVDFYELMVSTNNNRAGFFANALDYQHYAASYSRGTGIYFYCQAGVDSGNTANLMINGNENYVRNSWTGFSAGVWYHVAFAYNHPLQTYKAYVNGVCKTTMQANFNERSDVYIKLGPSDYATSSRTNIYIDEVRYYDGLLKYWDDFTPPTRQDYTELYNAIWEPEEQTYTTTINVNHYWNIPLHQMEMFKELMTIQTEKTMDEKIAQIGS